MVILKVDVMDNVAVALTNGAISYQPEQDFKRQETHKDTGHNKRGSAKNLLHRGISISSPGEFIITDVRGASISSTIMWQAGLVNEEERMRRSGGSIQDWVLRFYAGGPAALIDAKTGGRKPKLGRQSSKPWWA